jgi:DNA-binding IclR family transcriptional regulator
MVLRRSVFKGGGLLTVSTLRARIKERNEKENTERLRKAKKKLEQAKNK